MISYHRATTTDVTAIKKLMRETWTQAYLGPYTQAQLDAMIAEWHSPELLTKQIQDESNCFIVAKEGDDIIGMGNGFLKENNTVLYIERLHVSPHYQHQGIGAQLMEKVIEFYPQIKIIELTVEKHNQKAFNFYIKHDFKHVSDCTIEMQGVKMTCFVMRKSIS